MTESEWQTSLEDCRSGRLEAFFSLLGGLCYMLSWDCLLKGAVGRAFPLPLVSSGDPCQACLTRLACFLLLFYIIITIENFEPQPKNARNPICADRSGDEVCKFRKKVWTNNPPTKNNSIISHSIMSKYRYDIIKQASYRSGGEGEA